jgi:hypothetical protein
VKHGTKQSKQNQTKKSDNLKNHGPKQGRNKQTNNRKYQNNFKTKPNLFLFSHGFGTIIFSENRRLSGPFDYGMLKGDATLVLNDGVSFSLTNFTNRFGNSPWFNMWSEYIANSMIECTNFDEKETTTKTTTTTSKQNGKERTIFWNGADFSLDFNSTNSMKETTNTNTNEKEPTNIKIETILQSKQHELRTLLLSLKWFEFHFHYLNQFLQNSDAYTFEYADDVATAEKELRDELAKRAPRMDKMK